MQTFRSYFLLLSLILFPLNVHAAQAPNIVASIKPIHSLVAGVMKGVATPKLIVQGMSSPHGYSLKPSQARDLEQAQLIFWVGSNLETFLIKPLNNLSKTAENIPLSQAPGLALFNFREEHHPDEHDTHHEGEDHDHEEEHSHQGLDMHIWLDPVNAKAIVEAITDHLSELDPQNAGAYKANAAQMQIRLDDLTQHVSDILKPVHNKPYVVFHDAYQYFENRFSLKQAGYITLSPEITPGAKHLSTLQDQASESKARCYFSEPQNENETLSKIMKEGQFKTVLIDPIGATLKEGPELYFDLIKNMATTIKNCLES
jgi:zinc transport system substrate-binding protein